MTAQVKEDVMGRLKLALEHGKLILPRNNTQLLVQMTAQQCEPTKSGTLKFSHPAGTHDDQLWALGLAVYANEKHYPRATYAPSQDRSANPESFLTLVGYMSWTLNRKAMHVTRIFRSRSCWRKNLSILSPQVSRVARAYSVVRLQSSIECYVKVTIYALRLRLRFMLRRLGVCSSCLVMIASVLA